MQYHLGEQYSQPSINFSITPIPAPSLESNPYLTFLHGGTLHILEASTHASPTQPKLHTLKPGALAWKISALQQPKMAKDHFYLRVGAQAAMVRGSLYCLGGRDSVGVEGRIGVLDVDRRACRAGGELPKPVTTLLQGDEWRVFGFRDEFVLLVGFSSHEGSWSLVIWSYDVVMSTWFQIENEAQLIYPFRVCCLLNDKLYIECAVKPGSEARCYKQVMIGRSQQVESAVLTSTCRSILIEKQQKFYKKISLHSVHVPHEGKYILIFDSIKPGNSDQKFFNIRFFDTLTYACREIDSMIEMEFSRIENDGSNQFYILNQGNDGRLAIMRMDIVQESLSFAKKALRFKQWKNCEICYESLINNNTLMEPAFKLTKQLMQSMTEKIKHPFTAIGLFADSAISNSASYINFQYHTYKGQPYIRVEDDSKINYTNEELEDVLVNFQAEANFNFMSVERRVRSVLLKDFLKKEYGLNVKIGGLRLGEEIIHVSVTPVYEARVAYFLMENGEYVCYFYSLDEKTGNLIDEYCVEAKLLVESRYKQLVESALHENTNSTKMAYHKNTTFIVKLRTVCTESNQQLPQIEPYLSNEKMDIMFISPNPGIYRALVQNDTKIEESIDVSLSTYLSLLYIRNEHLKISLQLYNNEKMVIRREASYEKVDKSLWVKIIEPVDAYVKKFELKTADLMVNTRPHKKLGIFHNGVLLYHKNRLIKRFSCDLGDLLNDIEFSERAGSGFFNFFGRIELPDAVEVNLQKTDFVHQVMLQKLYSKLKFLEELARKKIKVEKQQPNKIFTFRPSSRRSGRLQQQSYVIGHPTKRVKKNQEDESYSCS